MSYLPTYTDSSAPNIPSNPPNMKKPPPENKPSKLLTKEENLLIFDILGKGRQTLATAVVQLLVPTHDQRHWQKKETGVVCFVRDQTKKSYYIQVLSLRERKMIFRQEIYNQFEYQMPQPFFLTFEGDNQMVGINFADTDEANTFRQVLDNKLEMKRRRRDGCPSYSYSWSDRINRLYSLPRRSEESGTKARHANSQLVVSVEGALDKEKNLVASSDQFRLTLKMQYLPIASPDLHSAIRYGQNGESNYNWVFAIDDDSSEEGPSSFIEERIRSRNLENQVQQNNVTIGSNALSQNNHISQHPPSANGGLHSLTGSSFNISSNKASKAKRRKEKEGKKNRLKKEDIGIPTDFRHVQHVGWDADKGFDLDISDPSVQTFFEKVGVSANQLEDKGTRSFIYDFIAKHGGVAALKNEVKNDISFTGPDPALPQGGYLRSNVNPPPPVPARVPSIPNAGTGKPSAPPPPPSRPVPPPPSSGAGPPPPPNRTYPSTARGPPAPKSSPSISKPSTPTSMHNGVCPPPPPPPPPPNFPDCSIPPPPPLIPSSSNTSYGGESDSGSSDVNQGSSEPRSELWEEIKKGVSLRHVKTDPQPKRSCDPSREWLGDIKSGNISLRPVPEQVKQQPNLDEVDGLAGALARALAERQRAMNPSDSSNSDDDEAEEIDDEEWDE